MLPRSSAYLALTLGLSVCCPAIAAPPPPPPQFVDDIARRLLPAPSLPSFDDYAALLANDLKVTVNGKVVARSKPEWLAIERQHLSKAGRYAYALAEGRDNILIIDRFDDRSDEHCPPAHGCLFDPRWHSRAVRYQLGMDHLIHAIDMLEAESIFQFPARR